MKRAWLVALAMGLLLPASAGARKECRAADPPPTEQAADEGEDRWPHAESNRWVHEGVNNRWMHDADADAEEEAFDASPAWVHQGVEYGWWAALPEEALNDADPDAPATPADPAEEECTVSRERNECMVLANQLATYDFRLGLAQERGDEAWEESLRATIERLEARGELYDCPWVEPSLREKITQTLDAVARAVIVAAQVYAKLQSLGLY